MSPLQPNLQSALHLLQSALHRLQSALNLLQSALNRLQSALRRLQSALRRLQSALHLTPDHEQPFAYRNLPPELRLMILRNSLPVQADSGNIPPMLAALAPLERLYAEAQEVYRKVNYVVTPENQHEFKSMEMKKMFRLTGIRLVYRVREPEEVFLTLRANKALLMNNLEFIAIDLSTYPRRSTVNWISAFYLINASKIVKRLTVKTPPRDAGSDRIDGCYSAIDNTNSFLGVRGIMERVVPIGVSETWCWEQEDGRSLFQHLHWSRVFTPSTS